MTKHTSLFRSFAKAAFIVPAFGVFAFLFCSQSNSEDSGLMSYPMIYNVYADVELIYPDPLDYQDSELLYHTSDGELYSGLVTYYEQENDQLYSKQFFEDGLMVGSIQFDEAGNQFVRYEYVFENGLQAGFRQFGPDNQIVREWVGTPEPDDSLTVFREWHPNGQLKFEMFSSSGDRGALVYEGLMTLYDEQGNILEQELYEDGELVEKIK